MKNRQAQSPSPSRPRNAPPPTVLPDDLIVEILSWLPVKSLVRFNHVCKPWKSIISDRNFEKLHLRRSDRKALCHIVKDNSLSVFTCSVRSLPGNQSSTIVEDDRYSLTNTSGYKVVGSCNGLICLFDDIYRNFYLWNPATKLTYKYLAGLLVNSYYRLAFGHDNLSDTYKVVAFRFNHKAKERSQKILVKIYSFGDNCWRNLHSFPAIPFGPFYYHGHNNGVYFNSTLNWLGSCNINSDGYLWTNTITIAQMVIVSLDLWMETYTQLLLPPLDEAPQAQPTIGVLIDCLCFFHDCKGTHLVIWQMKEFGVQKSWTQLIKVSYEDLKFDLLDYPFPLFPLCTSENGDVFIMTSYELQAILYCRRENRVERIELPKDMNLNSRTVDYIESLVSPCCN